MTQVQKGDVMIVAHTAFHMKRLTRTGLSTFTLEDTIFAADTGTAVIKQPYLKLERYEVTVGCSSYLVGAGRTITSNTAIFSADWVGDRIRIYNCEIELTGYHQLDDDDRYGPEGNPPRAGHRAAQVAAQLQRARGHPCAARAGHR